MTEHTAHMHYVGKEISPEQFISEHTFAYVVKGILNVYDGNEYLSLRSGESCLARKNRLARYNKLKEDNALEKYFVFFDEAFLRKFREQHKSSVTGFTATNTFIKIKQNELLIEFIQSLKPYYYRGVIKAPFADVKREELLLILLQEQPELAGVLFDFGIPQKINLEEFMNKNFKFNVSVERFAFLTGRSLSAFKRDFKTTFNDTPTHWLVKKRLEEAHFLIEKKKQKPLAIYLELGFESLSHFSYAFKKQFGKTPTALAKTG